MSWGIKTLADTALRAYVTDGLPGTGQNRPSKTEMRSVFDQIEDSFDIERLAAYAREFDIDPTGTDDSTSGLLDLCDAIGTGNFESTINGHGVGALPPGFFKVSAAVTLPAYGAIIGVKGKTVIVPSSGIADRAVVMSNSSMLDKIIIKGNNAGNGKIGLSIGATEDVFATVCRDVIVSGFGDATGVGNTGIGLEIGVGAVDGEHTQCRYDSNYQGQRWLGGTTHVFGKCSIKSNFVGIMASGGYGHVVTDATKIENNNSYGFDSDDTAGPVTPALQHVTFDKVWWEQNHLGLASGAARHAQYHARVKGQSVHFTHCDVQGDSFGCKFLHLAHAPDWFVHMCVLPGLQLDTIYIQPPSTGQFGMWPPENQVLSSAVSDSAGAGVTKYQPAAALNP